MSSTYMKTPFQILIRSSSHCSPNDPIDFFNIANEETRYKQIRQQNVEENMLKAIEHFPESFATVSMLYINCKVNNVSLKAFVDSGAQMTIMSEECAKRCNLAHLIDERFRGMAKGVGTQEIVGRVHLAPLNIDENLLQVSLSIMKDQSIDMLLGLDMLKRHLCCIDLSTNQLRFGSSIATPFLPENEIPKRFTEMEGLIQPSSSFLTNTTNTTTTSTSTNTNTASKVKDLSNFLLRKEK
ncbi:hypothetical protein SNEBB_001501 [Seison nebaliae]|nr:hypothetical protein SNEBB_001501 [Seison nebaliae]